ncbi:hypothetical protein ACPW96_23150 [Micromonospora sp. DT81.3]|uniref:hypothetical protein n=1 Tax=Micromonospora sp. DT81.3 TaxID=3416523 RepID=UPI003CEE7642
MNGQRLVTDPSVRQALAHYFGVQPHHLTRDGRPELLPLLSPHLPAIPRYRLEKVRAFAWRQAAGVASPAINNAITYLDSLLNDGSSKIEDLLSGGIPQLSGFGVIRAGAWYCDFGAAPRPHERSGSLRIAGVIRTKCARR